MISYLPDAASLDSFIQGFKYSSLWGNFVASLFCALFVFTMRTETSTKKRPWTIYLALLFSVFAVQYFTNIICHDLLDPPTVPYLLRQIYGILIVFFLLIAARTFANKPKLLTNWIIVILLIDITRSLGLYPFQESKDYKLIINISTYLLSAFSFLYFGYSVFLNTKVYKRSIGWLVGFIYGAIHLVAAFLPSITDLLVKNMDSSLAIGCKSLKSFTANMSDFPTDQLCYEKLINEELFTILLCIAIPLKVFLFFFAFRIANLENRSLIKIRRHLGKSVKFRQVFFSGEGLLRAVKDVFKADSVKLEVAVPSEEGNVVHVFSYDPDSEPNPAEKEPYEQKILSEPLHKKFAGLQFQESERLAEKIRKTGLFKKFLEKHKIFRYFLIRPRLSRKILFFFNGIIEKREILPFDGIVPIRYHGGLIGSLTIKTSSNHDFTFSARRLSHILSEDISTLVQFYRLHVSAGFLIDEMTAVATDSSFQKLNEKFTKIIHKTLSPLTTKFTVDAGFVNPKSEPDENDFQPDKIDKKLIHYCKAKEINGGEAFGRVMFSYNKGKDLFKKPSMGSFKPYSEMVSKITARFYILAVEQKLNKIVEELSAELTKRQTEDEWFEVLTKNAEKAEFQGIAVIHPDKKTFWGSETSQKNQKNENLVNILESVYHDPQKVFEKLDEIAPTKILLNSELLIIGIKLPLKSLAESRPKEFGPSDRESALLIGIERFQFANELDKNSPWKDFLINLSEIADNSLSRILFARNIQRNQAESLEKRELINRSYLINYITHTLINRLGRLSGTIGLIISTLFEVSLETPLYDGIIQRMRHVQDELKELQNIVGNIVESGNLLENTGPGYLFKSINKVCAVARLKLRSEVEIKFMPETGNGKISQNAGDMEVSLSSALIENCFTELINNAIRAINDREKSSEPGNIEIRTEIAKDNKFVDVYVQDNGTGILPGDEENILNINVSKKSGGGLGLAITAHMLKTNGGSIKFNSPRPGKTICLVRIPIHNKNG